MRDLKCRRSWSLGYDHRLGAPSLFPLCLCSPFLSDFRSDQIAKDFYKLVWEKLRRNRGLLLTFSAQLVRCVLTFPIPSLLLLLYLLSLAPPNCFPFYQMSLSFTLIIIKLYCCVVLNCGQSLNMWMMEKVCLV